MQTIFESKKENTGLPVSEQTVGALACKICRHTEIHRELSTTARMFYEDNKIMRYNPGKYCM